MLKQKSIMNKKDSFLHSIFIGFMPLLGLSMLFVSGGCQVVDHLRPTPNVTEFFEQALLTATNAVPTSTPTETPVPATATPVPTDTPTVTATLPVPADLPAELSYAELEAGSIPQTYIDNTCEELSAKLNPGNAAPGTVVMPIMYHSVAENGSVLADNGMDVDQDMMENFLTTAKQMGFETITMEEMVNFMEKNAYIPQKSLMIIIDDRRPGVFRTNFYPFLEEYDWHVSLAWPIGDTDSRNASYINDGLEYTTLWQQMEAYYKLGRFDIQGHGYVHNIPISTYSTDEFILHEVYDSRLVLQEHFYCKDADGSLIADCETDQPLAYIWPGGGFSQRGIELARESGYHLGFTTFPRGPVMYNWVPLAEEKEPNREYWVAEAPMGDPLMTIPRYWSQDAVNHLQEVVDISDAAAAYEAENHQTYVDYYNYYCQAEFGPLTQ
jgi:hypothetical protein